MAGNTRVTYAGANAACMLMGAELVVVDSDAKNAAVVAAKAAGGMADFGCWLGRPAGWRSAPEYMRNGFAHEFSYDGTEHCLHMMADGSWEDKECGFTMGYVCEMPMPPPSRPPPFPPNLHPRPPPPRPPLRPPPSPAPASPPRGITEDGIQMLIVIAAVCGFCCLCCGYCALQRRRASDRVDAEEKVEKDERAARAEVRRASEAGGSQAA